MIVALVQQDASCMDDTGSAQDLVRVTLFAPHLFLPSLSCNSHHRRTFRCSSSRHFDSQVPQPTPPWATVSNRPVPLVAVPDSVADSIFPPSTRAPPSFFGVTRIVSLSTSLQVTGAVPSWLDRHCSRNGRRRLQPDTDPFRASTQGYGFGFHGQHPKFSLTCCDVGHIHVTAWQVRPLCGTLTLSTGPDFLAANIIASFAGGSTPCHLPSLPQVRPVVPQSSFRSFLLCV